MSPARQVFELARRDFVQRAKSKAFIMALVFTVGIVLVIGPLISLADSEPGATYVGLVGELPAGTPAAIRDQADQLDMDVQLRQYATVGDAEAAVAAGEIRAAVSGGEMIFQEEVEPRLAAVLSNGVSTAERELVAADLGLSPRDVDCLLFPVILEPRTLGAAETDEDQANELAALIGLMLLYISILMFGQFVMMGVMEEKQTRVVEVVLSRVKPTQVLIGKVIGVGLLGLIQIIAVGGAAILTLSTADLVDIDVSGIGVKVLGLLIVWYLLGYAFYSFLYGALGATISRQEDMQGVAMIPVLLILPGFFLGQLALMNPHGTLATVASFLPIWSPMVMAVRSTASTVPIWEVATAIALLLITTYLLVQFGGRIYRGAILQTASKTKLRAAWRSAAD